MLIMITCQKMKETSIYIKNIRMKIKRNSMQNILKIIMIHNTNFNSFNLNKMATKKTLKRMCTKKIKKSLDSREIISKNG